MKKMAYNILKRAFDIVASLLALIVTSPLWLIFALGIKLSSPGPVFYTSFRAGKDHKPISVRKFRSMHMYTPTGNGMRTEGGFIANENRVFPLGAFLRKSKLDELPQMLCVFLGQMSFVGPRPYPEKTVRKYYSGAYEVVMSVRPGLTGLDSLYDYTHGELFVKDNQVYRETVLPVRTELAKIHVENAGVALDAYCILRTVKLMTEIVMLKKKKFGYTRWEKEALARVEKKKTEE